MFEILDFINEIKSEKRIIIQMHNFPDNDAVASAYGLSELLLMYGIKSDIIYKGEIERDSLVKMAERLNINISKCEYLDISAKDKIVVIDGCKGNSNVEELEGEEILVIDHHEVKEPEDVKYTDIRSSYGACSTIIYTYYKQLEKQMSSDVATALMIGLNVDTARLTRGVSKTDLDAFYFLYTKANMDQVNLILKNYIKTADLNYYKILLQQLKFKSSVAFCYFENGCSQNLLGIIGDFVLSLEEIDFVILCAKNNGVVNFSIRNEKRGVSAASIIQEVLDGIGFGGGHIDMAGGIIKDITKFNEDEIHGRFINIYEKSINSLR